MKIEIDNYLNLTNPLSYKVNLLDYDRVHMKANFSLKNMEEQLFVTISSLFYYSGPVKWSGANFCLASTNDCLTLANHILPFYVDDNTEFPKKMFQQKALLLPYRLYIIPLASVNVKLLAMRPLHITKENDDDYLRTL